MFKGKCINPQGSNTDLLVSKMPETIHLSPCYLPGGGVPDKKRGAESRNLGVPSAQINKTDESKHKDWSLLPCATRIRSNYNTLETPLFPPVHLPCYQFQDCPDHLSKASSLPASLPRRWVSSRTLQLTTHHSSSVLMLIGLSWSRPGKL